LGALGFRFPQLVPPALGVEMQWTAASFADHAEPRRVADRDGGDVAHANWRALLLGDDDVADVDDAADEAEAAHVERLPADGHAIAAHVGVGVLDGIVDLVERDAATAHANRVDLDVVLLGLAAERGHIDDPRDATKLALEDPVLRRLQIL